LSYFLGIFSALGASLSWTYACFVWRSQTHHNSSLDINLLKNLFAFIFFAPVFFIFQDIVEFKFLILLLLSGVIGIGFGDTFYLKSLQLIGTRKTLSIEALSPIFAAFSGGLFINEYLSVKSWIGIVFVSISIIYILKNNNNLIDKNYNFYTNYFAFRNYIYSFLSVICAVIGALLSRYVFLETNLNPLQTTEIRLLGSLIFLIIISKFKVNFFIKDLKSTEKVKFILSILLGTNIGIYLQQLVFKNLPLGIGWTILSTSPIFSLFLAKREEGKLSNKTITWTIFLFLGISLIIL
tara:strand:- start:22 stop:906 length:885 start_codon:yes stop_codon:yes gene_type:complete